MPEQYIPTPTDLKKAQSHLTPYQKIASNNRERAVLAHEQTTQQIATITAGRPLSELTIPELQQIKQLYQTEAQALGLTPETKTTPETKYEQARELMGANFYGQEEIKNTLGIDFPKTEIPPIPFSPDQLTQAKALGERLILRVSHDTAGQPLTLKRINEIMTPRLAASEEGKLLYNTDWYQNENFYKTTALKTEWQLVGGSFIPDSTNKNYIHQTRILRNHLKSLKSLTETEEQQSSDQKLQELSEQMGVDWNTQQITNPDKYNKNWKTVAQQLSELQINQNHRRTPAEIIYDQILQFKKTKDRGYLATACDWSSVLASGGSLVDVGYAGSGGAYVSGWYPDSSGGDVGVVSLRGSSLA